ncbi:MAG: type II toxin-antitoxin system VapC family toxin [Candidatus Desulforudis sp.]|nr:type II toxin-antitoxin system VapC family toxin [Desulforudis sp.]
MRVLLDTHAFLWWIIDDPRLSSRVRTIISEGTNEIFLSAASGWEIAIKAGLGRLQQLQEDNLERFISEQLALNAILSLPIRMSHALHVYSLPLHHRDPFDRMLVAQSQLDDLPVITADPLIARYPVKVIW